MPSSGKAAANIALPQPPNTSQNVPKNSAQYLFIFSLLGKLKGAILAKTCDITKYCKDKVLCKFESLGF